MTGIVLVSHSRPLAEAARDLATQMAPGAAELIHLAAGMADGSLGTDATAVMTALEAAAAQGGAVVLMDLGSALLSAEMALELVDPDVAEHVVLSDGPFVEGLVAAAVTAAAGAAPEVVAREAGGALGMKSAQLGTATQGEAVAVEASGESLGQGAGGASDQAASGPSSGSTGASGSVVVRNPHGLHARPAATLVSMITGLSATVELRDATSGSDWIPGDSIIQVMSLGVEAGHTLEIRAAGPGAQESLAAIVDLANEGFGEG